LRAVFDFTNSADRDQMLRAVENGGDELGLQNYSGQTPEVSTPAEQRCAARARSRSYLQALKLRLRLNGIASLTAPIPDRPKRMHRRTYQRLRERLEGFEQRVRSSRRFMSREVDYTVLVPK
jgi:hypothetical protein